MVEILLHNGAEVNAACKVICDDWAGIIQGNACQGSGNEDQSVEMTLAMADCIERIVHGSS